MGTVINLCVIPRKQNPNDLHAAQVAEIIVSKRLVAPPVVIGPAFMEHERLVEPQLAGLLMQPQFADYPYVGANYALLSRPYVEVPETFADFGRANEPQIVAFGRLDETNPAVRNEFSHSDVKLCSHGRSRLSMRCGSAGSVISHVIDGRLTRRQNSRHAHMTRSSRTTGIPA